LRLPHRRTIFSDTTRALDDAIAQLADAPQKQNPNAPDTVAERDKALRDGSNITSGSRVRILSPLQFCRCPARMGTTGQLSSQQRCSHRHPRFSQREKLASGVQHYLFHSAATQALCHFRLSVIASTSFMTGRS